MKDEDLRPGKATQLVCFRPEHADFVSAWYYDFQYRFFFRDFGTIADPAAFKTLDARLMRAGLTLLTIIDRATQKPIGVMTFMLEKAAASVYKFGILLDRDCQNRTFAIESIIILGDYLFNRRSARKLVVEFCERDTHIHRISQLGGFKHEATLPGEIFMDGEYLDEARSAFYNDQFDDLYGGYLDSTLVPEKGTRIGS